MLPRLGIDEVVSPVDAFILDVGIYVDIIHPKLNFVFIEDFDPSTYFITSGDAIEKTKSLCKDLTEYKTDVLKTIQTLNFFTDSELDLLSTIDKAIENSSRLLNDLYVAKGENCFLETEWESHEQKVIPKNPRR